MLSSKQKLFLLIFYLLNANCYKITQYTKKINRESKNKLM